MKTCVTVLMALVMCGYLFAGAPQAPRAPQAPPVEDTKIKEFVQCNKEGCNSRFCNCGDDCHCYGHLTRCSSLCGCGRLRSNQCNCSSQCTCGCQDGLECICGSATMRKVVQPIYRMVEPTVAPVSYNYQTYTQPPVQYSPQFYNPISYRQPMASRRGGSC